VGTPFPRVPAPLHPYWLLKEFGQAALLVIGYNSIFMKFPKICLLLKLKHLALLAALFELKSSSAD